MATWTDDWSDDARAEYLEALQHYLDIDPQLASDFSACVDRSILLILQNRSVAGPYLSGTRRKLIGRFPFGIVYREYSDKHIVEVVAFIHLRRRPGYWLDPTR
ncbi:type II toxin-antitoxin system RelE/ParE family toxin [Phycisphaeraceae bacterium D3-23]